LFLTLNGWFAYCLLKDWVGATLPAFLAGLMAAGLPFVAQEMGVLQLVALFGFLWSLFFLSRFLRYSQYRPSPWSTNLGLALGLPVTFLTCGYYGLFSLLFLPLFFLTQLRPAHFKWRTGRQLLWIGLLALILGGPFLWAQDQQLSQYGFTRQPQTIEANSARLSYYSYVLDYNVFYGRLFKRAPGQGQRLFPGFGIILLAGLGLWGAARRAKFYLFTATGLALLLSLGLRLHLGPLQPYEWVREYIPGFAQLRSPFRFALLVQTHLALLAGFGLSNLVRWLPQPPGKWVSLGLGVLVLGESLALPLPLQRVPHYQAVSTWQSWLNQRKVPPQIVILPFAPTSGVADFEPTVHWMLENRSLRVRMLNGYSGFFPRDHASLRDQMLKFPTPEGIAMLRARQIDYMVVQQQLARAPQRAAIQAYLPLVYWDENEQVAIYALVKF
jgi:hypothetical protein